jgi:hypothetical protein
MNCGGTACGVDLQEVYGSDFSGKTFRMQLVLEKWDELS